MVCNELIGKEPIMLSWKAIESSREIRLWLGQVIIPAVTIGAVVLSNPENRKRLDETLTNAKDKVTSIFHHK